MPSKRTGAEQYFDERLTDPEYRVHYEAARRRTNQFDAIIRLIEQRRIEMGLSYVDLACRADLAVDPEDVERIHSLEMPNLPFRSVVDLADAVGLELVANQKADVPLAAAIS